MISNQSLVLVEDGVARGVSKGHRALVFRNGDLTTVDGEGSETPVGASTASVQAALDADPQGALDALEGGTLLVDYLEIADREGLTIPDSSYGQKGGIPYFGNSPLSEQLQDRLAFKDVVATVGAVGTQKFHIGGFPVGASQAVNGQSWGIVVEITIDGIGLSLPAVGQDMYLVIRLGTGAITLAQSTAIEITPAALYQKVRFIKEVSLSEVTGNLKPVLSEGFQELSQAAAIDTDSTYIPFAAATLINNTTANAPINTATTLDFYLFGNWTVDDFYMVQFAGSIQRLSEELATGELA